MRTLRLARIAAEAEGLRLRHHARRTVVRAVLAAIALGFLSAAVVFAHVAAWCWLREFWERPVVALMLSGSDLVLAVLLGLLAARSSPGRVELEASDVRQRALQATSATVAWTALVAQSLRVIGSLLLRSRR
jgi:hypothetical protein